jgi:hypothetical protein
MHGLTYPRSSYLVHKRRCLCDNQESHRVYGLHRSMVPVTPQRNRSYLSSLYLRLGMTVVTNYDNYEVYSMGDEERRGWNHHYDRRVGRDRGADVRLGDE